MFWIREKKGFVSFCFRLPTRKYPNAELRRLAQQGPLPFSFSCHDCQSIEPSCSCRRERGQERTKGLFFFSFLRGFWNGYRMFLTANSGLPHGLCRTTQAWQSLGMGRDNKEAACTAMPAVVCTIGALPSAFLTKPGRDDHCGATLERH